MAEKTYTAAAIGVAFASAKSLLGLMNAHATRKIKLWRAWQLNNQTTSVTGVLTSCNLRRINSLSGGTAITPIPHDTSNATVDLTSISCITGGTFANNATYNPFRVWMWSSDEPAVSSATSDELECIVPLMCTWDSTGSADLEPIVCNNGEGIHITQPGANAVGISDIFMEFSVA